MWKYLLSLTIFFITLTSIEAQTNSSAAATSFAMQQDLEVKAYPNPATTDFTVEIKNGSSQDYKLIIYNILGRELKQVKLAPQGFSSKINVSSLKKGVYLYRIFDERGKSVATRRLMVVGT